MWARPGRRQGPTRGAPQIIEAEHRDIALGLGNEALGKVVDGVVREVQVTDEPNNCVIPTPHMVPLTDEVVDVSVVGGIGGEGVEAEGGWGRALH